MGAFFHIYFIFPGICKSTASVDHMQYVEYDNSITYICDNPTFPSQYCIYIEMCDDLQHVFLSIICSH